MSNDRNFLFLFDIDGTIIKSDGAGSGAVKKAFQEYFGKTPHMDGFIFDGKTDPLIFSELAKRAGIHPIVFADNREVFEDLVYEFMGITVKEKNIRVINQMNDILEELHKYPNVFFGLVTGNDKRGADHKLNAVNIRQFFRVGAFGNDDPVRNNLPPIAVRRAERLFERVFANGDIWIIGDTPNDIKSGRVNNYGTIGVATGRYSTERLKEEKADIVVDTLDPDLFRKIINGEANS